MTVTTCQIGPCFAGEVAGIEEARAVRRTTIAGNAGTVAQAEAA